MEPIQSKKKKPYNQKTAKLTPEEQAMREENLQARKNMHDSAAVRNLCSAICLNSCHEYRALIRRIRAIRMRDMAYTAPIPISRKGRPRKMPKREADILEDLMKQKKELEEFFDGDMFTSLTGVSGKEEAIRKILSIPDGYDHLLGRRLG